MLGLALFWVGAVLFLNGLWLLGRIGDNEIAVIDVFVGVVRREDDHLGLRVDLPDPAYRLDPLHLRHPQVHQDDVGPMHADALVLRAARAFEAARPWPLPQAPRASTVS